jgi:hypothetical protein
MFCPGPSPGLFAALPNSDTLHTDDWLHHERYSNHTQAVITTYKAGQAEASTAVVDLTEKSEVKATQIQQISQHSSASHVNKKPELGQSNILSNVNNAKRPDNAGNDNLNTANADSLSANKPSSRNALVNNINDKVIHNNNNELELADAPKPPKPTPPPIFTMRKCYCWQGGNCNERFTMSNEACINWCKKTYTDRFLPPGEMTITFLADASWAQGGCVCCGQIDPCKPF